MGWRGPRDTKAGLAPRPSFMQAPCRPATYYGLPTSSCKKRLRSKDPASLRCSGGQKVGWARGRPFCGSLPPEALCCQLKGYGRSARAAHLPTCPASPASISLPSILTGLASRPVPVPPCGQSRERGHQVLPSTPAYPSTLPPTLPLAPASSPPHQIVIFP